MHGAASKPRSLERKDAEDRKSREGTKRSDMNLEIRKAHVSIASRLEAIAIALRLEAIASRFEAIAIGISGDGFVMF